MSSSLPPDPRPSREPNRPADAGRREFLGSMAAVVVGVPAILAACDSGSATGPAEAGVARPGAPRDDHVAGSDPWWTLHHKIESVIGSSVDVKIPTLERTNLGYLQRVITDNDRVGTGLATILRSSYKFADGSTLSVQAQTSTGKRYPARTIYTQDDLVYATLDALSTNTLFDGVLRESLNAGNPVVATLKPSVVQFWNSVSSDYYGNHLQVASQTLVDIIYASVGQFRLTATTRDLSRS